MSHSQSLKLTQEMQSFSVEGMPIILRSTSEYPDVSSEIVTLSVVSFAGAEISQKAGTMDILTQVMMKGTYSYTKDQIEEIFNRTGASFNIRADFDEISVTLKCLKRFLPQILPIVSEIIRVPKLEESEIKIAQDQLLLELKAEQDHPDHLLGLLLHQNFYRDHPYFHRPSGYLESVPQIKKEDLSTALFQSFNRQNVFFVMIGNLSRAEAEGIVSQNFKNLNTGSRSPNFREPPKNMVGRVETRKFDTPTDYFVARFKAPALESPDYPALAIAMQILDSRFFEEVRTKRALTYAVSANLGNSRINTGGFYVSSPKLTEAIRVMFDVLRQLEKETIDPKLLESKVNKALSSWYAARETRSSQARIFSLYESYGIGWENADTYIDRLQKVTPQQIQSVLKKYLKDFTFVVISSSGEDIGPVLKSVGAL